MPTARCRARRFCRGSVPLLVPPFALQAASHTGLWSGAIRWQRQPAEQAARFESNLKTHGAGQGMPSRVVTASGGKPTGREPANGILTGADIMSQALPFSCATFAQRNALGNKLRRRDWALAATYLAAYVVLAWVSFIHTYRGVPITPWDPGLGAVFALMMRLG